MKRYMVTLVLFIGAITSRTAFADTWTPGTPKPPSPVPDTWLTAVSDFFSEVWSYLMY